MRDEHECSSIFEICECAVWISDHKSRIEGSTLMESSTDLETSVPPQASGPELSIPQSRGTLTQGSVDIQTVVSIEDAFAFLEKLKESLDHVPVCINQFRQVIYRCGHLLEALLAESDVLGQVRVQQAAMDLGEVFKSIHRQLVKASIYGRPKAFVYREDFSTSIATAHLQLDVSDVHILARDWELGFELAKSDDSRLAVKQLEIILRNEQDIKIIYLLGKEAVDEIQDSCKAALDDEDLTATQRGLFSLRTQEDPDFSRWGASARSQMLPANDSITWNRIKQSSSALRASSRTLPEPEIMRADSMWRSTSRLLAESNSRVGEDGEEAEPWALNPPYRMGRNNGASPKSTSFFPTVETLIERRNARKNPPGPAEQSDSQKGDDGNNVSTLATNAEERGNLEQAHRPQRE
ncbi:hypothetical protein FRC17_004474 [Serendipita sp. 399]|nr:hypothetical protein FRC17_004474 [Serendipita sp. 399]